MGEGKTGGKKPTSPLQPPRPSVPELVPACSALLWEALLLWSHQTAQNLGFYPSAGRKRVSLCPQDGANLRAPALRRQMPSLPARRAAAVPGVGGRGGGARPAVGAGEEAQGWPPPSAHAAEEKRAVPLSVPARCLQPGLPLVWKLSAWGLVPELSDREETGPGINGLLIYSSYIIFFPSRAYKSHAPCKNRI